MIEAPELDGAVELAPRVWWVGAPLEGDRFQCHVYLIEQGDQSVLIDPGSALAVDAVTAKIASVVGLDRIRWLVCSHSDPDIVGAIPGLLARGLNPAATIVTHWRDAALLRHLDYRLDTWRPEEHGWTLELEDRSLQFVFTPYAHFAGAFCTFDPESGVLFSSDLFGGFSRGDSLVATSLECLDGIRPFHEHYMPGVEALAHAIDQLRDLPIRLIAPQHGWLLPASLIQPVMDDLRSLECGLYLMARDDPGLAFLFKARRALQETTDAVMSEQSFEAVAERLAETAREQFGAESVDFWARAGETLVRFDAIDSYAGRTEVPPADVIAGFGEGCPSQHGDRVIVPLRAGGSGRATGVAALHTHVGLVLDDRALELLARIGELVAVALSRHSVRYLADRDRAELYRQATHDALTGLHNRAYLQDLADRACARDDRNATPSIAVVMLDIDYFKRVNDTFGHPAGDRVLAQVATVLENTVRACDMAVRYGGEEFLVLLADVGVEDAVHISERLRVEIEHATSSGPNPPVTVSAGLALRCPGERFEGLVTRADRALYRAKAAGRNNVVVAD